MKKRLIVDEQEATIVRRIYGMALGREGPCLGVKAIVNRLNGEGVGFRGKLFRISAVHRVLTSSTYTGRHCFNRRCAKTGDTKPADEWVFSDVPVIIPVDDAERVRASLTARDPRRTPPRVVSSPILLTGIARCGTCGSGMTIRTGKSGRYRYYACAAFVNKGAAACPGRSLSMAALDGTVLEHLTNRLFTTERLTTLLEAFINKSQAAIGERQRRLGQARAQRTEIEGRITRLLELVMTGKMGHNDPAMAGLLVRLKASRGHAEDEIKLLNRDDGNTEGAVTPDRVARFAEVLRGAIASEDPAFRRAYLRLFVDTVVVNDTEIRISGPTASLAKAASTADLPPAAAVVPSFVQDWRPVRDSNSCYRRERAVSWASRRTGQAEPNGSNRQAGGG